MDSIEVSKIKNLLVDVWENAFHVTESNSEISIYVEVHDNNKPTGLWDHIPSRTKEKKFIYIHKVPFGYIENFFNNK